MVAGHESSVNPLANAPAGGEAARPPAILEGVRSIVDICGKDRSRLLDILQETQKLLGWLSPEAITAIAQALGMHRVAVEDVATFYAFLNREPKGRFHILFANTPMAVMRGAREVVEAFAKETGAAIGKTSPDGDFTLEWAGDLGLADQEPSALVNGLPLTQIKPADVAAIIKALRACRDSVNPLPLFPGADASLAHLPQAQAPINLIQGGPMLFNKQEGGQEGGYDRIKGAGLEKALTMTPEAIIQEVAAAKLRGRGGAGYPTALKWKSARQSPGDAHYIVCNADEGEPGTFKDRALLTLTPHLVFEGMTIGGRAIGARQGVLYLRGEYAYMRDSLEEVLKQRRAAGLLGADIGGAKDFDFDIRIQLGAGAYVCGEESALLNSLDGRRGAPRDRPPYPTDHGYLLEPTALDNVESFCCAARILAHGADWFKSFGTPDSPGMKLFSVSGDCARPGVYEVPFGITVAEVLDLVGGADAQFVQVGGPSSECVAPKDFGRRIAYEDMGTGGSFVVFGPQRDVLDVVRQFMGFFVDESCGWCAPCRVGTTMLKANIVKIIEGRGTKADIADTFKLANVVKCTSRCGLGQSAPSPILSTMRNFPQAYEERLQPEGFIPRFSLDAALANVK